MYLGCSLREGIEAAACNSFFLHKVIFIIKSETVWKSSIFLNEQVNTELKSFVIVNIKQIIDEVISE